MIIVHEGRLVADGKQQDLAERFAGAGHVRFEAVVGDVREAIGLLESLEGVARADERGRQGVHHAFDVFGAGDLREDVGALAAQRGWAVRELSWRRPTLEEIFARLVLGGEGPREVAQQADAGPGPPAAKADAALTMAPQASTDGEGGQDGAPKVIYSLNPFDRGAERELGRPMDPNAPQKQTGEQSGGPSE